MICVDLWCWMGLLWGRQWDSVGVVRGRAIVEEKGLSSRSDEVIGEAELRKLLRITLPFPSPSASQLLESVAPAAHRRTSTTGRSLVCAGLSRCRTLVSLPDFSAQNDALTPSLDRLGLRVWTTPPAAACPTATSDQGVQALRLIQKFHTVQKDRIVQKTVCKKTTPGPRRRPRQLSKVSDANELAIFRSVPKARAEVHNS